LNSCWWGALIGGVSMLTLRSLSGLLGVVSVAVLYLAVRRMTRDVWLALLAALLLAIYPLAVLYSRFGFSYNLLSPLVLLAFLGLADYSAQRSRRWLAASALSIGLGAISDLWMWVMLAPFVLIVLFCNWRDLLWGIPLALLPFGAYVAIMLLTVPQAFMFDLHFVLTRVNQLPLDQQLTTLWQNITTLARQDIWMISGSLLVLLSRRVCAGWQWHSSSSRSYYWGAPPLCSADSTISFRCCHSWHWVASLIRSSVSWFANKSGRRSSAALAVLIAVVLLLTAFRLSEQARDGSQPTSTPFCSIRSRRARRPST
jgi:4-amino-4-deoxy-L-arabinose transferase-like glycosyltransferase